MSYPLSPRPQDPTFIVIASSSASDFVLYSIILRNGSQRGR